MATTSVMFEFYKIDHRGLLKYSPFITSCSHQHHISLNQQQTGSISLYFSQTLCYYLCNKVAKLLIKLIW